MYIGLAEYYSAELSQKIKRGLHESRQKGFCGGGRPPYGYFYKDRRVCIDEERADVIRFIFKEYYSGKVVREIIDELTEKGVLYHGKRFIENTIFKILHNEKYIGIRTSVTNSTGIVRATDLPPCFPITVITLLPCFVTSALISLRFRLFISVPKS